MKYSECIAITAALLLSGCTNTRVVQSRYVIQQSAPESSCRYTWQEGDYWEFLAWALLDDVSSSSALALISGYSPEILPAPGTEIIIPIEEAACDRMDAARLVALATAIRETDRIGCMNLLIEASRTDSAWSVPVTNITVMLLEDGRTEEALEMLRPMAHKNIPALILAGIAWRQGNTGSALRHLSEALATPSPRPEVLAAAGIAWSITGEKERAGTIIRRLLEDPDAPADLRILALRYALLLGED
jgi:hypothetical protein